MTKNKYRKYFNEYTDFLNEENKGGDLDLTLTRTLERTITNLKKGEKTISGIYRFKDGKFMRVFYQQDIDFKQEVLLSLCSKDNRVLAMMTLNNKEN